MKKLTIFILLLTFSQFVSSQTLELDPKTQTYTYTEVLEFDSITKSTLYANTLKWISTTYVNPEKVILFSDANAGSIVINANFSCQTYPIARGYMKYRLQIDFKDNKIRCYFLEFNYSTQTGNLTPFESDLIYKKDELLSDTYSNIQGLLSNLKASVKSETTSDW